MSTHKTDVSLVSGRYFDWANIGANSHLQIVDVASGLASTNRYCGQIKVKPYNVAQHSVLVTQLLQEFHPDQPQLWFSGLMHDATESLMGDITSPLKRLLPDYQRIEDELHGHMARWFGFNPKKDPRIRHADLLALAIEKHLLLQNTDVWDCLEKAGITALDLAQLKYPLSTYLPRTWDYTEARMQFLSFYHNLAADGLYREPQLYQVSP